MSTTPKQAQVMAKLDRLLYKVKYENVHYHLDTLADKLIKIFEFASAINLPIATKRRLFQQVQQRTFRILRATKELTDSQIRKFLKEWF